MGKQTDNARPREEAELVKAAFPLCSKGGARGHYILLDVRESVLDERKDDVVGLWTQTLLARDELDGWSGLRPYVAEVPAGSFAPETVPR